MLLIQSFSGLGSLFVCRTYKSTNIYSASPSIISTGIHSSNPMFLTFRNTTVKRNVMSARCATKQIDKAIQNERKNHLFRLTLATYQKGTTVPISAASHFCSAPYKYRTTSASATTTHPPTVLVVLNLKLLRPTDVLCIPLPRLLTLSHLIQLMLYHQIHPILLESSLQCLPTFSLQFVLPLPLQYQAHPLS